MKSINIIIAEDHNMTAVLLSKVIKRWHEINVVGIASNGKEVIKMVQSNQVDTILLDLAMPEMDGFQTMDIIFKNYPKIKVIILTATNDLLTVEKAMIMGSSGYLTKMVDWSEIHDAISTVFHGGTYIERKIATELAVHH